MIQSISVSGVCREQLEWQDGQEAQIAQQPRYSKLEMSNENDLFIDTPEKTPWTKPDLCVDFILSRNKSKAKNGSQVSMVVETQKQQVRSSPLVSSPHLQPHLNSIQSPKGSPFQRCFPDNYLGHSPITPNKDSAKQSTFQNRATNLVQIPLNYCSDQSKQNNVFVLNSSSQLHFQKSPSISDQYTARTNQYVPNSDQYTAKRYEYINQEPLSIQAYSNPGIEDPHKACNQPHKIGNQSQINIQASEAHKNLGYNSSTAYWRQTQQNIVDVNPRLEYGCNDSQQYLQQYPQQYQSINHSFAAQNYNFALPSVSVNFQSDPTPSSTQNLSYFESRPHFTDMSNLLLYHTQQLSLSLAEHNAEFREPPKIDRLKPKYDFLFRNCHEVSQSAPEVIVHIVREKQHPKRNNPTRQPHQSSKITLDKLHQQSRKRAR